MQVVKRDGSLQEFNADKIREAVDKACVAELKQTMPKEHMDQLIEDITGRCQMTAEPTIEQIQNWVEEQLMELGYKTVARSYILYRNKRAEDRRRRLLVPDPEALSRYIAVSKYARHIKEEKRRETWEETIDRDKQMFLRRFPQLHKVIEWAFTHVKAGRVMPAMRSLQFGGVAIEDKNERMYNCAFTLVNRTRVFAEIFYTLLCGCGMGYSVQYCHVAQLPEIKPIDRSKVDHFVVPDTIIGWAEAFDELMKSFFITGRWVEFAYHEIRKEGAELKKSGGKAPGHLPLRTLIETVRAFLLQRAHRQLRPIEVHDIICWAAEAVLSGGIRRSSLISLFSVDDSEMAFCKAHENFDPNRGINTQRRMANNSAVLIRGETSREQFFRILRIARQYGDPGFYWTNNRHCGCNPCGEIGLYPVLSDPSKPEPSLHQVDNTHRFDWRAYEKNYTWSRDAKRRSQVLLFHDPYDGSIRSEIGASRDPVTVYGHDTGIQFCNLCETVAAACKSWEEWWDACSAAAFIGTLQATYNSFPFLGPVTEAIVWRESLLGVGITGMQDAPWIFDADGLHEGAIEVSRTNEEWAHAVGLPTATRATTIKPSGTASLVLNCASGIHPHHARRYFRRVTANRNEPPAQFFRSKNPHMVEDKPNGDWVITFPVKAPDTAKDFVKTQRASEFLDLVFLTYESWIRPGSVRPQPYAPGLTHNVSCTVTCAEDEWTDVLNNMWDNQHRIAAMSLQPQLNDKNFSFAPREEVLTDADWVKWEHLIVNYTPVDWSQMREDSDGTAFILEPACAGGACEV